MHRGWRGSRTTHPVSDLRHRGGGGNESTSLDALREVFSMTLKDTSKEAKLHEGSASSVRLLVIAAKLSRNATQTQIGGETHPSLRG